MLLSIKKKKAQHESCELSFIWGKMKIAAQETVPQIALKNCTKEVGDWGEVNTYVILKGGVHASKHISLQV